jgi:uncharacterized membrane protein
MTNEVATIRYVFLWVALGIDLLAVAVIVAGVVKVVITLGTVRYIFRLHEHGASDRYKQQLGRPLLLGLLLSIAGDAVQTMGVQTSLTNVAALGLLVFVRTVLSWSMFVEMEGRWPWQSPYRESSQIGDRTS